MLTVVDPLAVMLTLVEPLAESFMLRHSTDFVSRHSVDAVDGFRRGDEAGRPSSSPRRLARNSALAHHEHCKFMFRGINDVRSFSR